MTSRYCYSLSCFLKIKQNSVQSPQLQLRRKELLELVTQRRRLMAGETRSLNASRHARVPYFYINDVPQDSRYFVSRPSSQQARTPLGTSLVSPTSASHQPYSLSQFSLMISVTLTSQGPRNPISEERNMILANISFSRWITLYHIPRRLEQVSGMKYIIDPIIV